MLSQQFDVCVPLPHLSPRYLTKEEFIPYDCSNTGCRMEAVNKYTLLFYLAFPMKVKGKVRTVLLHNRWASDELCAPSQLADTVWSPLFLRRIVGIH